MSENYTPPPHPGPGFNREGRGRLVGYVSDMAKHRGDCAYRRDPIKKSCTCPEGLWADPSPPAKILTADPGPKCICTGLAGDGLNGCKALQHLPPLPQDDVNRFAPQAPMLRAKNSAERKGEPIYSGVMKYFPDALAAIARWSLIGNDKHNPGEPLGWQRGKSMDQMDCMIRHSLTKDVLDSGEAEGVAMAWRALAQLQLDEEKRLHAAGIMPYSGITP